MTTATSATSGNTLTELNVRYAHGRCVSATVGSARPARRVREAKMDVTLVNEPDPEKEELSGEEIYNRLVAYLASQGKRLAVGQF